MTDRRQFLGVPLDPIDMRATVAAIVDRVERRHPGAHLGLNAANLIAARDSATYMADLVAADLLTADGQSIVWGTRIRGVAVPERVTGIDLMQALLAEAAVRGWRVALVGARAPIVERLADRLRGEGVRIATARDGYFADAEMPSVAADVRSGGADLLFVGMPSPMKERFIIHHARPAGIPFSVGVGGSFDVLSGEVRRAPRYLQRAGLEWAFRLTQEPRRLFTRYAVTNVRFLWLILTDWLGLARDV